ncbi:MAG: GNAT family N-acetyltransferase [Pseudolabrys sp.]|nr:GNAT family N-acetyltransferase [Pseudolabrys sp.]
MAKVRDNPALNRFEMDTDAGVAFATYRRDGGVLTVLHSEVPAALKGRGLGSALVRGMLDLARADGLKVRPLCGFVARYMTAHPEYADLRQ